MAKRALRRHHYKRLKAKARDRWLNFWGNDEYEINWFSTWNNDKQFGSMANTPCTCSGLCCGNPRRNEGTREDRLTIQERKSESDFKDQLQEL